MHPIIESAQQHPSYKLKKLAEEFNLDKIYHQVFGAKNSIDGNELKMFGSNNYLGLANNPEVKHAALEAISTYGSATTGSRLLNGTFELHKKLDNSLAALLEKEDAISFTTGYQANVGVITALLRQENIAIIDEYVHASIYDGLKLSKATVVKFPHNDVNELKSKLEALSSDELSRTMIIVDSIYSMEGSKAPLEDIATLAREFKAALMVDEAHGIGTYGEKGRGWTSECGVMEQVDIYMGSLSKALASTGGFIAGSADLIDLLKFTSRSLIFSTSSTPAATASAIKAIDISAESEGDHRRCALKKNARYLRNKIAELLSVNSNMRSKTAYSNLLNSDTPIVPFPVGNSFSAAQLSRSLFSSGFYVGTAVYPAVPDGEAILRLCVTSDTLTDDMDQLVSNLTDVVRELR